MLVLHSMRLIARSWYAWRANFLIQSHFDARLYLVSLVLSKPYLWNARQRWRVHLSDVCLVGMLTRWHVDPVHFANVRVGRIRGRRADYVRVAAIGLGLRTTEYSVHLLRLVVPSLSHFVSKAWRFSRCALEVVVKGHLIWKASVIHFLFIPERFSDICVYVGTWIQLCSFAIEPILWEIEVDFVLVHAASASLAPRPIGKILVIVLGIQPCIIVRCIIWVLRLFCLLNF